MATTRLMPLHTGKGLTVSIQKLSIRLAILDIKAQHGMFIGPRAPFGYRKSTENKLVIEPDPEAAKIVTDIFCYGCKWCWHFVHCANPE